MDCGFFRLRYVKYVLYIWIVGLENGMWYVSKKARSLGLSSDAARECSFPMRKGALPDAAHPAHQIPPCPADFVAPSPIAHSSSIALNELGDSLKLLYPPTVHLHSLLMQ
jgi:hypothetical protein